MDVCVAVSAYSTALCGWTEQRRLVISIGVNSYWAQGLKPPHFYDRGARLYDEPPHFLWRDIVFQLFALVLRNSDKLTVRPFIPCSTRHFWTGAKFGHPMTKMLSASGGLRPPDQGLCPQTPVIGSCSALAMVPSNHSPLPPPMILAPPLILTSLRLRLRQMSTCSLRGVQVLRTSRCPRGIRCGARRTSWSSDCSSRPSTSNRTDSSTSTNCERAQPTLYTGRSDVTESMITIRSSFCGYNTIQCVEFSGKDLSCY